MKKNSCATTIIVICVMAVVMTLSLGLFLTASVMTRTAGRTLASEQCRILAVSLSDEIQQEICSRGASYKSEEQELAGKIQAKGETSLWHYIRQNISDGSWAYYKEDEGAVHDKENATRSFTLQKTGTTGEISDITISIYWTPLKGQSGGVTSTPDKLYVKTTVEVKQQVCTVTDIYQLDESTRANYSQWSFNHVARK